MADYIEKVETINAPAALGPYSQSIAVGFDATKFLFVSGQLPIDPRSGKLIEGDIRAAARRVLDNIAAILDAAGLSMTAVVRVEIFLKDLADFAALNEIYKEYFFGPAFPARQTIQVARLPLDASIEVSCIAVR